MTQTPEAAPVPPEAAAVFGDRVDLAARYAGLLATSGTERGLIGPREADRLWDRHLLNSAVVGELVPDGARVLDVGSGAGLPGIPLAIARPDVQVELVEPLLRRTSWLDEVLVELGLTGSVVVTRGKVAVIGPRQVDVVTARAVAPLERLLPMCMPLLRPGGVLLALKGEQAQTEVDAVARQASRWRVSSLDVGRCGSGVLGEATTVVVARRSG
ncbi:16S rRNA (guanine(527)-N(7))-methyltransferase RsmG [Aquipuribacter hungaricus]|uniref:Ribosomal RNA small subunit methyltransferase G n=1 Tax=Aquipuribacter hungaricus TaxID=545624 RepID=A0ABV7WJB7_9MICO